MRKQTTCSARFIFIALSATAVATHAAASRPSEPGNADARYRQERAECFEGRSQPDTKSCLKEATAALRAARQRELDTPDAAASAANARKRCDVVPDSEKQDCLARSSDQGASAGTVASGGILRETVTVHAAPVPDNAASK